MLALSHVKAGFKSGDVVHHRWGDRPMTIDRIAPNGCVLAVWFVENELHSDVFDPALLEAVGDA